MVVKRFEVWNVELNPTQGSDKNKTRTCFIVSPNREEQKIQNSVI